MNSKVVSLDKLPPTSSSIKEHIRRGFSFIQNALNLLSQNRREFNPVNHGWFVAANQKLYPVKGLKMLPEELLCICGCKGKCRGRCKCATAGQVCVPFCHKDHGGENCVNK